MALIKLGENGEMLLHQMELVQEFGQGSNAGLALFFRCVLKRILAVVVVLILLLNLQRLIGCVNEGRTHREPYQRSHHKDACDNVPA